MRLLLFRAFLAVSIATCSVTFAQAQVIYRHRHVTTGTAGLLFVPATTGQAVVSSSQLSFVPSTNLMYVPSASFGTSSFGTSNFGISSFGTSSIGTSASPSFTISVTPRYTVSGCQGSSGGSGTGSGSGGFEGASLPVGDIVNALKLFREIFGNPGAGNPGNGGGAPPVGGTTNASLLAKITKIEQRLTTIEKKLKIPTPAGKAKPKSAPGGGDFGGASLSSVEPNAATTSLSKIQLYTGKINENQQQLTKMADELRKECLRAELELREQRRSLDQSTVAQKQALEDQLKTLSDVRTGLTRLGVRFDAPSVDDPPEVKKELPKPKRE